MKKSNKILITIIITGTLLFSGIIFRSYILDSFINPLAMVVWIFLRIFVLSIDQKILWGAVISGSVIILIFRFSRFSRPEEEKERLSENIYMRNFEFWRFCFSAKINDIYEMKALKKNLIEILVTSYASKKRIPVNYLLFDAFKKRDIAIPDKIYSFLYYERKKKRFDPYRLLRRLSGRDVKEYYHNLEESILFLENFSNDKSFH